MRVLLVCNEGISAAVLARRMGVPEEASRQEPACHVTCEALGLVPALREAANYDLIMLAPQVVYAKRDFENTVRGSTTRVWAIPLDQYRNMDVRIPSD